MLWLTLRYDWSNVAIAATLALLPIVAIASNMLLTGP